MNINIDRGSFSTAIIDSSKERRDLISSHLRHVGYECLTYSHFKEFEDVVENLPPHFVFLSVDDADLIIETAIQRLSEVLPETHIFVLSPEEEMHEALKLYELGIYDCLALPLDSPLQLVKAVDRSAQLNFYYYQSEQLEEKLEEIIEGDTAEVQALTPTSNKSENFRDEWENKPPRVETMSGEEIQILKPSPDRLPNFRSWLELLYSQPRQDLAIQTFFKGIDQAEGNIRAVFFKYIPQRRTLMAALWHGYEDKEVKSVGLNFNELLDNFQTENLREPSKLSILSELAEAVFKAKDFRWDCHVVLGEVQGLFLFVIDAPDTDLDLIDSYMSALQRHTELLELEKRLHSNSLRDPGTDVLNKHTLLRQVADEVARARRVELPTSLVLISLDQYFDLKERLGTEESEVILRAIARIFIKHSRVNDVIGRVGSEQFALVLPHTDAEGAMIKAERLRRIVESADFSKIIRSVKRLSISVAVSEYPSLCRDAEELFSSADEALFQLRSQGGKKTNAITKANVAEGFEPDFVISKKGS